MSAVPVGVDGGAAHESRANVKPRDVHRFVVMAIDRRTGRTVWERTAQEERARQASMKDGTWASSSPITDGQHGVLLWQNSRYWPGIRSTTDPMRPLRSWTAIFYLRGYRFLYDIAEQ